MGSAKSYLDIRLVPNGCGGWTWMVGADLGPDEFRALCSGTAPTRNAAREAARKERSRIMTTDAGWRRREVSKRRLLDCAASIARKIWAYGRRPKK